MVEEQQKNPALPNKGRGKRLDFPRVSFPNNIPETLSIIARNGGEAERLLVVKELGISEGWSGAIFASAKNYGLVDKRGRYYVLTKSGEDFVKSIDNEKREILLQAFLNVDLFRQFFQHYTYIGDLPSAKKLTDPIVRLGIESKNAEVAATVIKLNLEYFGITFQEVKDRLNSTSSKPVINKNVDIKSENNHKNTNVNHIPLFELGFRLGQQLKDNQDMDKLAEDLTKMKAEFSNFPHLLEEIDQTIEFIHEGIIRSEKFPDYAKKSFGKAIKRDITGYNHYSHSAE